MNKMRGLVIDTETTGLSHNFNQVLTVGMLLIDINKNKLSFIDSNHLRVKHEKYNVSGIALKINKINLIEHNKIGVFPNIACNEINSFVKRNDISDVPLIGHNIGFDLRFLRELYRQNQKKFLLDLEIIDTRDLWINLRNKGVVPSHLNGRLRTVAEHFDVDYENAHDALADCQITAKVFYKMLEVMRD